MEKKKAIILLSIIFAPMICFIIYVEFFTCAAADCAQSRYPGSKYCEYDLMGQIAYHKVYQPNKPYSDVELKVIEEHPWIMVSHCFVVDCSKPKVANGDYCIDHTCHSGFCTYKVTDGGQYCDKHTEKKQPNKSSSSGSYVFHGSHTEWPDCDDYDSLEDFLDDWDGEMPNGMDAEDYWDNW